MTKQRYFEMCEMMGTTPIEDEIPIELEDFPDTIQTALAVYSFLRDDWDSVNGEYLGKIFTDVDLAFRAHYVDKTLVEPLFQGAWKNFRFSTPEDFKTTFNTKVDEKTFLSIADKISTLPKDKKFLNKIERLFADRNKMAKESKVFDWAMAELMAYATLMNDI